MQCPKRSTLACTARAATRLVRAEQLRAAALGVLLAEQVGGRHAGGLGVRVVRERVYKAQAHALHQRVHVLRAAPGRARDCAVLLQAVERHERRHALPARARSRRRAPRACSAGAHARQFIWP